MYLLYHFHFIRIKKNVKVRNIQVPTSKWEIQSNKLTFDVNASFFSVFVCLQTICWRVHCTAFPQCLDNADGISALGSQFKRHFKSISPSPPLYWGKSSKKSLSIASENIHPRVNKLRYFPIKWHNISTNNFGRIFIEFITFIWLCNLFHGASHFSIPSGYRVYLVHKFNEQVYRQHTTFVCMCNDCTTQLF